MKKCLVLIFSVLFLFTASAWGANTTTYDEGTITITGLDADWNYATEMAVLKAAGSKYPKRYDSSSDVIVESIQFIPGATNDRLIVHGLGGLNASPIFDTGKVADAYDTRIQYYGNGGRRCTPIIDILDCTLAAGTLANCVVKIHVKQQ